MKSTYSAATSSQISLTNSNETKKQFEFSIEALRGFAAIIVVIHHSLFLDFSLDPNFSPKNKWVNTLPGHSCVLLFFILSGYVIGLTNNKHIFIVKNYLRKRFTRLYPIYIISLISAIIIASNSYKATVIVGHFLFLQNSLIHLIYENNPLWSLNNEVLYYLIFIPLFLLKIKTIRVCLACFALGIFAYIFLHQTLLCSYSIGFAFWTSGLWLAQSHIFIKKYTSRIELIGLLLIFMGYESLNPFSTAILATFDKLNIPLLRHDGPAVQVEDVGRFIFLFYIFLRFTNRTFKGGVVFIYSTIGSGFAYYCYSVIKYKGITSIQGANLFIPVIFLFAGFLMISLSRNHPVSQHANQLPPIFLKLGAISYGIYVIHFPISILLSRITLFSGTALTFCVRLLVDIALVILAGYLLELKFQPWAKRKIDLLFN